MTSNFSTRLKRKRNRFTGLDAQCFRLTPDCCFPVAECDTEQGSHTIRFTVMQTRSWGGGSGLTIHSCTHSPQCFFDFRSETSQKADFPARDVFTCSAPLRSPSQSSLPSGGIRTIAPCFRAARSPSSLRQVITACRAPGQRRRAQASIRVRDSAPPAWDSTSKSIHQAGGLARNTFGIAYVITRGVSSVRSACGKQTHSLSSMPTKAMDTRPADGSHAKFRRLLGRIFSGSNTALSLTGIHWIRLY